MSEDDSWQRANTENCHGTRTERFCLIGSDKKSVSDLISCLVLHHLLGRQHFGCGDGWGQTLPTYKEKTRVRLPLKAPRANPSKAKSRSVTSVGKSERMRTVHLLEAIWKVKLITPRTLSRASSHKPRWSYITNTTPLKKNLHMKGWPRRRSDCVMWTHNAVQALDVQGDTLGLLVRWVEEELWLFCPLLLRCAMGRKRRRHENSIDLLRQIRDVDTQLVPTWGTNLYFTCSKLSDSYHKAHVCLDDCPMKSI